MPRGALLLMILLPALALAWLLGADTWLRGETDAERDVARGLVDGDELTTGGDDEGLETGAHLRARPGARSADGSADDDPARTTASSATPDEHTASTAGVAFTGRVLGPGGRPMEEVEIRVRAQDGTVVSLQTDAQGRFTGRVSAGFHSVALRRPGVGARLIRRLRVDGSEAEPFELTLQEPVSLDVQVLQGETPLADAPVRLEVLGVEVAEALSREGTTGPDGVARFDDLPKATYQVSLAVDEALDLEERVGVYSEKTHVVRIPARTALGGTVRDGPDGPPVSGARVSVEVQVGSRALWQLETTSDRDGLYQVHVPRGRIVAFDVQAVGFQPWPNRASPVERRQSLSFLRPLGRGTPVVHDIALQSGAVVEGLVTDADDAPMPGIEIRLQARRLEPRSVVTNAEGRFRIVDLGPATYDIVVATSGWYLPQRMQVVVPGPPYHEPLARTVVLHPARRVSGVVVAGPGEVVQGARVWLAGGGPLLRLARNAGRTFEVFTDAAGAFTFHDVPTDPVRVFAAYGSLRSLGTGVPRGRHAPPTVRVELLATGTLEGEVFDRETREPLREVRVDVQAEGGRGTPGRMTLRTDREGRFRRAGLLPGTYRVLPTLNGYLKAEAQSVALSASETPHQMELPLDPGYPIEGMVVDEEGRPVQGVRVRAVGTVGDASRSSVPRTTDATGRFRLTGLELGAWTLVARRSGYRATRMEGLRGGERGLTLTLRRRPTR